MATKQDLLEQLMQIKSTLITLKSICKDYPERGRLDEIRIEIMDMDRNANSFIDMIEKMGSR